MSKRISNRVREEAALLCSVVASNRAVALSDAEYWLDISPSKRAGVIDGFGLACAARVHIQKLVTCAHNGDYRLVCAEAESLLRCGWSPGDEP